MAMPKPLDFTIRYDPIDGYPIADGLAEDEAKELVAVAGPDCDTSNHLVIEYLRLMRAKGEIGSLTILFNDEVITCNTQGMLDHWPPGFCDHSINVLSELLDHLEPTIGDQDDPV